MNLLVKYATRSRPFHFELVMKNAFEKSVKKNDIHYLVSYDLDDPTINLKKMSSIIPERFVTFVGGISENKVHACNRDMDKTDFEWDAVMLLSDDMVCQTYDWDGYISDAFAGDYDKAVHFPDGYHPELMTLALIGKKYYERFNYIYNPEYKSLFCDNEMHEVAQKLGKYQFEARCLFKHQHYSNVKRVKKDALMEKTESFFYEDQATYERRKLINFGI